MGPITEQKGRPIRSQFCVVRGSRKSVIVSKDSAVVHTLWITLNGAVAESPPGLLYRCCYCFLLTARAPLSWRAVPAPIPDTAPAGWLLKTVFSASRAVRQGLISRMHPLAIARPSVLRGDGGRDNAHASSVARCFVPVAVADRWSRGQEPPGLELSLG